MGRQLGSGSRRTTSAIPIAGLCIVLGCASEGATDPARGGTGTPPSGSAGSSEPEAGAGGAASNAGDDASTGTGAAGTAGSAAGNPAQPAAGAAGDDGFAAQVPPPDPNLTFDWQQTRPGVGECQPGRYSGTFSCMYMQAAGFDPIEVTGPVDLVLERAQNGEFLEIADGRLEGFAQLIFGFTAQLAGRLDCTTNVLQAEAVDGVYGFGDPNLLPFGMFAGALTGTLDRTVVALDGDWDLTVVGGGACVGPWTARFVP
jgi:hypothetical protein